MDAEGQYVLPKVIEIADGDCELLFEQFKPTNVSIHNMLVPIYSLSRKSK